MQQMVGYVELADIGREESSVSNEPDDPLALRAGAADIELEKPRASIRLAIVDPSRNDRDHLSDALIWEIMQHAFNQHGLQWVGVVLHHSEAESLECFRKHGFYDAYRKVRSWEKREYLELVRNNRY